MRHKTDEKKHVRKQSIQAKKLNNKQQTTPIWFGCKKAKLDSSSTLHKKIMGGLAGMMIHDFQPYNFHLLKIKNLLIN